MLAETLPRAINYRSLPVMSKSYLAIQPSEGLVFQAAARIYAAYIVSGRVAEGDEQAMIDRSIAEAISMAEKTDDAVVSDDEVDTINEHL